MQEITEAAGQLGAIFQQDLCKLRRRAEQLRRLAELREQQKEQKRAASYALRQSAAKASLCGASRGKGWRAESD